MLGEKTILTAYKFALRENASEFVIVRDFHAPGISASIIDGGTSDEIQLAKQQWISEEEEKMKLFVRELNLKKLNLRLFVFMEEKAGKPEIMLGKKMRIFLLFTASPKN